MFKRYLNHLVLPAVGAAVIGAAELTARYIGFGEPPLVMRDDKIEYYLAPSRSYTRFGHDIRVNRYSMRSDDVDMATVDYRFSFSVLGDSVVYGNRLDQADTLPAQLQKLLTAKGKDQKPLVNSIAASSWGPENLLEFYKRFGPFPGHTAWIVQSTADMVDVTNLVNKVVPYRTASPHGALHDLALSTWRSVALHVLPDKADPVKYEDKRHRADIALHALITALKVDYARVILVFHATRDEAIAGKADGLAHYRAFAKDEAINFISTMELYAHAYKSNVPPHYDDIHLNKDGARVLSERLASDVGPIIPEIDFPATR
jgi:lysophospholipase L1-like esterase